MIQCQIPQHLILVIEIIKKKLLSFSESESHMYLTQPLPVLSKLCEIFDFTN